MQLFGKKIILYWFKKNYKKVRFKKIDFYYNKNLNIEQ